MKKPKYSDELVSLGIKIRELRSKNKLTQNVLASLCDLDTRTIQRIEKGEQNITLQVLFDLSKSLNIEPDLLLKSCFR